MAGVPGSFADHAQIDEPQTHRSDDVMFDRVIKLTTDSQFPRAPTRGAVFGDRRVEALALSDTEAGIAALRGAVTLPDTQTT